MRPVFAALAFVSLPAFAQAPAPPPSPPASASQVQPAAQGRPAPLCPELQAWLEDWSRKSGEAGSDHAVAVTAPPRAGGAPAPKGNDAPQASSGLSGPVQHAGPGAAGPQGASGAQPQSAQPAPAPSQPASPVGSKLDPALVQKSNDAARGADPGPCRDAVQQLRRAGAALPGPLLALGALDLRFYGDKR